MKNLSRLISSLSRRIKKIIIVILGLLLSFIFIIGIVIFFSSDQALTDPIGWENSKIISDIKGSYSAPSADARGNLVAVVYEGEKGGKKYIFISLSFDGGNSFIQQTICDLTSSIESSPKVAISRKGEICVVWNVLSDENAEGVIFSSKSLNLGGTWTKPIAVDTGLKSSLLPFIRFDELDRLHLFFMAYSENLFTIFHSIRDGDAFLRPESVASFKSKVRGSFFPDVKFYKNNAILICQVKEEDYSDSLYMVKSENYGKSWEDPEKIPSGNGSSQFPSIEIFDDIIFLVYVNNSEKNWAVKLLRGYNLGKRWDEVPLKVSQTNANCYSPTITSGVENDLLIAWHDLREKSPQIFYRKYDTKNREFFEERKFSIKNKSGRNPFLISSGKRPLIFWNEGNYVAANSADIQVDPPEVYSTTHKEDSWSRETAANIYWKKPSDPSGIAGYATLIDRNPETNPSIQNLRYDVTSTLVTGLDDGVTYFHIRAIDGAGNMSRTVHYKLMVSSNPLSMPVVISSTHPENVNSTAKDAVFRWAVNDTRRLKGFVYSLSKDSPVKPSSFINDFEIEFKDLQEGIYFFNIASISKTNQISRVTTYSFMVGRDIKTDQEYLKNIANIDLDSEIKTKRPSVFFIPTVDILVPFDFASIIAKSSVKCILRPKNIPSQNVDGYSVTLGRVKIVPAEKVNHKGDLIELSGLSNGDFTIGVKCRYFTISGGVKKYRWSEAAYKSFSVILPAETSPYDGLYFALKKRLLQYPVAIASVFMVACFSAMYRKFFTRLDFWVKKLFYR